MARRPKFPYETEYEAGPFIGVRDTPDPEAYDPAFASDAENLYVQEPERGGAMVTRPGYVLLNPGAALGSGGARTGQEVFQFTELDGDEHSVLFCGGKMYELTWPNTFTDRTPVAGVNAPGGFTISTTAIIYCVHFADYLIVTDGVNRPWKYTFATHTASYLTDLTYAVYGPPTVYAAKLFFIKNSERNKIVYSEELDPDSGYDAGGNPNFWKLGLTKQDGIQCLHGTNENLYWFRESSIGAIYGEVSTEFQTDSTHDGISRSQGTLSPKSVISIGNFVWFVNQLGRPCIIAPGGGVREIWHDCAETVRWSERGRFDTIWAHHNDDTGLVGFAHALNDITAGNRPKQFLMFQPDDSGFYKTYQGQWKHRAADARQIHAGGMLKEANKRSVLVHLDQSGFAWFQRLSWDNSAHWDELSGAGAGATAIRNKATSGYMGYDENIEHLWDTAVYTLRGETDGDALELRTQTSQADWTGIVNFNAAATPATGNPGRGEVGLAGQGRWIRHELAHEVVGASEFALLTIKQFATAIGADSRAA